MYALLPGNLKPSCFRCLNVLVFRRVVFRVHRFPPTRRNLRACTHPHRSYWTYVLMNLLRDYKGELSIRVMSNITAIKTEDIISTLQSLNLIRYWKGQHVIAVSRNTIDDCLSKSSRFKLCRPECLTWPVEVED